MYVCACVRRVGGNRKLLSEDSDFKNAFQKNFPVSNEQIDAFNRGQREFIDAQLKVLTLEHEEIQQQVEKARLELLEDEDYTSGCGKGGVGVCV